MLVPPHYQQEDPSWSRSVITDNPLALLISAHEGEIFTSHVPVIPSSDEDLTRGSGPVGLNGCRLLGHLNRSNPHWTSLRNGSRLVFTGPGAYVTPSIYGTTPAAPTWNFIAVHLTGRVRRLTGKAAALHVVMETVKRLEESHGSGWDMTESIPYFEEIVGGIGAFEFEVTESQAMFKLSQEKSPQVRRAVADALETTEAGEQVAAAMHRFGCPAQARP